MSRHLPNVTTLPDALVKRPFSRSIRRDRDSPGGANRLNEFPHILAEPVEAAIVPHARPPPHRSSVRTGGGRLRAGTRSEGWASPRRWAASWNSPTAFS